MDEIVCANTAFRYWRCPPQVRDLYPRLPNSEDGWRALSQSPFVVDVLKPPIITITVPGGVNYHSGLLFVSSSGFQLRQRFFSHVARKGFRFGKGVPLSLFGFAS